MKDTTKTGNTGMFKTLAVILALLIAFTAVGVGLGRTFAAPGDVPVELEPPTGFIAANVLEVGSTATLTVGNLYQARSGDTSIATVAYDRNLSVNNITTTAVKAGIVTIAYGTRAGMVNTARYLVTDSDNISSYTLHDNGELNFGGSTSASQQAPVTIGDGDSSTITWSSSNEAVATVDPVTGVVTPVGDGAAIIIGHFIDKWGREQCIHILAVVGDIGGGGGGGTMPPNPIDNIPTGTDAGRTLGTDKTGDTANWLEIARNGDYSLIVRTDFINTNPNSLGQPSMQGVTFGAGNNYRGSNPQTSINDWFNGYSSAQNLAANARLRNYTVSTDAAYVLGTSSSDSGGLTNGFSKPTHYQTGFGNDIAFALSFCEAANFISKEYNVTAGGGNTPSSALAIANFGLLKQYTPAESLWLRTPGTNAGTATALTHGMGRAFQLSYGTTANLVYPAVWVHSSIFN